jgi:hypothetical protein
MFPVCIISTLIASSAYCKILTAFPIALDSLGSRSQPTLLMPASSLSSTARRCKAFFWGGNAPSSYSCTKQWFEEGRGTRQEMMCVCGGE